MTKRKPKGSLEDPVTHVPCGSGVAAVTEHGYVVGSGHMVASITHVFKTIAPKDQQEYADLMGLTKGLATIHSERPLMGPVFKPALDELCEVIASYRGAVSTARLDRTSPSRGRPPDYEARTLAEECGHIWLQATGAWPTLSRAREDTESVRASPWVRFVNLTFKIAGASGTGRRLAEEVAKTPLDKNDPRFVALRDRLAEEEPEPPE